MAAAHAQTRAVVTVSAASYEAVVAPNSLATIFGSGLAPSIASAVLDASGNLPSELAGTTVEIDGKLASLIYVSPSQINLVIPEDAALGTADVLVRGSMGSTQRGSVLIAETAPALFSLDASGKGAGAILNAVTFTPAPFLAETSAMAGSDKRTRLAVYATGIRYAGNPTHDANGQVTVQANDASGNSYQVEYAGAAPGFFGLDQLNIVLPPEMDGAGIVSLFVTTSEGTSNTVTFRMDSLPSNAIHAAALTLSPAFVTAGNSVLATVSLNGRAPVTGANVSIQTDNRIAQTPISATIPQGQTKTQFNIATTAVNTAETATITAMFGGVAQTAALEIDPANAVTLQSFTADLSSIQGGRSVSVTATLNGAAPAGGVAIALTADNAAVHLPEPAVLMVPFGRNSATLSIATSAVLDPLQVSVTATLGRAVLPIVVTLNPPFVLSLASAAVIGGNTTGGTFVLSSVPSGASSAILKSSDPGVQIQPPSLSLASGQTSASFSIVTQPVTKSSTVLITASSSLYPGVTKTVSLSVNPPETPQLDSVTLNQTLVTGGGQVTGYVTLTSPAPSTGVIVILKSSDPHGQPQPGVLTIAGGMTSATFVISTAPVKATTQVTITATSAGISKSAVLTIQ